MEATLDTSMSKLNLKRLISRRNFSGPRKFTKIYQWFEITAVKMQSELENVSKTSS